MYNISTNAWEDWVGWVGESALVTLSRDFAPKLGYSKIAYAVYANNSCGSSEQSRELTTNLGVPLANLIVDQFVTSPISAPEVSKKVPVNQFIYSKNSLDFVITSNTPEVCKVESSQITFLAAGSCKLLSKATSKFNVQKADDFLSEIIVNKKKIEVVLKISTPVYVGKQNLPTINSNYVVNLESKSLTPETCSFENKLIVGIAAGTCQIIITSAETDEFSSASQQIDIKVWPGQQTFNFIQVPDSFPLSQKTLKIDAFLTSGLRVESKILTPRTCNIIDLTVNFLSAGICTVRFMAPKTADYLDIPFQEISFDILAAKSTIICKKGKITKKVMAINPVCPNGYKVKK